MLRGEVSPSNPFAASALLFLSPFPGSDCRPKLLNLVGLSKKQARDFPFFRAVSCTRILPFLFSFDPKKPYPFTEILAEKRGMPRWHDPQSCLIFPLSCWRLRRIYQFNPCSYCVSLLSKSPLTRKKNLLIRLYCGLPLPIHPVSGKFKG